MSPIWKQLCVSTDRFVRVVDVVLRVVSSFSQYMRARGVRLRCALEYGSFGRRLRSGRLRLRLRLRLLHWLALLSQSCLFRTQKQTEVLSVD